MSACRRVRIPHLHYLDRHARARYLHVLADQFSDSGQAASTCPRLLLTPAGNQEVTARFKNPLYATDPALRSVERKDFGYPRYGCWNRCFTNAEIENVYRKLLLLLLCGAALGGCGGGGGSSGAVESDTGGSNTEFIGLVDVSGIERATSSVTIGALEVD